jgi:hypothetical protein
VKKLLFILHLLACAVVPARAQVFRQASDMTPPVLNRYLARAITMQGLMDMQQSADASAANQAAYRQQLAMLANLDARYIGRVSGMWGGEKAFEANMAATQQTVADIRAAYLAKGITEMPIVQGAIFEIITGEIDQVTVPGEVVAKFYPGQTASRKFNHRVTSYDSLWIKMNQPNGGVVGANPACPNEYPYNCPERYSWGGATWAVVPDMSKPETQMWFYYVATRLLDAGCEAIHFGQVEMMDRADPGHASWWKVLTMIRQYAATKNRGLVLCDAHTQGVYYDPAPASPLLAAQRQLLFDLHAAPLRPQENARQPWSPGGGGAYLDARGGGCGTPIYAHSKGGVPYLGWGSVSALPYLVEFDNFGILSHPGQLSGYCAPWQWDEISWFGAQTNAYRNQWLKYAYYKVQCLDGQAHLEMPGLRGMVWQDSKPTYRASNGPVSAGNFNQETMIRDLWEGVYDKDWSYMDLTAHYQPGHAPGAASHPVWVGDKLYYIGTDKYLHGFIKKGEEWDAVSPSELAGANGQRLASQVKAAGGLVATPDGKLLVYRGVDGELYAFDILDSYHYYYHKLAPGQLQEPEKVKADLICLDDNRLYYRSASDRVYAYARCCGNQWAPVSPSWAANQQVNISDQAKVMGGLVASPARNRLYYSGRDGLLHGFVIDDAWNYRYFDLPRLSPELSSGQLVCAPGDRLFFIDQQSRRVVGAQLTAAAGGQATRPAGGGTWARISPAYDAQLHPTHGLSEQVPAKSDLTSSPDGTLLAYIGVDDALHGYRLTDAITTEYLDFTPARAASLLPASGLQLSSATRFCYLTPPQLPDWTGELMTKTVSASPNGFQPTLPPSAAASIVVGELTARPTACNNPAIARIEQLTSRMRSDSAAVLTLPVEGKPLTSTKISAP